MPRAEQPLKEIRENYDVFDSLRELEFLHDRINGLLVPGDGQVGEVEDLGAALKVNYATGDLNTEAEIITAFNTTNARINEIAAAVNSILAKVRQTP